MTYWHNAARTPLPYPLSQPPSPPLHICLTPPNHAHLHVALCRTLVGARQGLATIRPPTPTILPARGGYAPPDVLAHLPPPPPLRKGAAHPSRESKAPGHFTSFGAQNMGSEGRVMTSCQLSPTAEIRFNDLCQSVIEGTMVLWDVSFTVSRRVY